MLEPIVKNLPATVSVEIPSHLEGSEVDDYIDNVIAHINHTLYITWPGNELHEDYAGEFATTNEPTVQLVAR